MTFCLSFFQTLRAQRAVIEMRGRSLRGSRIQTDYASHESRSAFFEQCKRSGLDIRERGRQASWEDQQQTENNENNSQQNR